MFPTTFECFNLTDGRYGQAEVFGWDETMKLTIFPDLVIDLWKVFAKKKPEAVNEPYPGYSAKDR